MPMPNAAPVAKKEAPIDTSKMSLEDVFKRVEVNGKKKLDEEHKKQQKISAPFVPSAQGNDDFYGEEDYYGNEDGYGDE